MSEHTEVAIVAGGCFWPAQELLRRRAGVLATRVGYTGDEQRRIAGETIAAVDATGMWPGPAVTKVSPAGTFWPAGDEDQEYLRHYPDGKDQFRR